MCFDFNAIIQRKITTEIKISPFFKLEIWTKPNLLLQEKLQFG
jgi:hypothetical protein